VATSAPESERLVLPGPAGALEALIETPHASATPSAKRSFGVILHPHPLHGGTMDNKVVHTLSRAFQEHGAPTIRFNFRGVGGSEGTFADGMGETEDALAVIAAGRERWPDAHLWLGGFSFGAAVALRVAERAQPRRLVTVAPATTRIDLTDVAVPDIPWLLVHGEADDVVDPSETLAWAERQQHRPQVVMLPACGHFFHGKLIELRDAVDAFLKQAP
jgi:alpha/beta superfamily hydrolase